MAKKYELIGCYYNKYAENKYQNEQVIKIDGVKLDSLESIDKFTSLYTYQYFTDMLGNIYPDKNMFSIRVSDSKSDKSYFLKTIYDDKELNKVLGMTTKKTIDTAPGKRTVSLVPLREKIVYQTFAPIKEALVNKDYDEVSSLIYTRSDYMFKLERFCKTSYDEGEADNDLASLEKEFCDYQIFRDAYLPRIKKKVDNLVIKTNKKPVFTSNIAVNKETQFTEQLVKFNQDEKEEFLDEAEYAKAYGDNAPYQEGGNGKLRILS